MDSSDAAGNADIARLRDEVGGLQAVVADLVGRLARVVEDSDADQHGVSPQPFRVPEHAATFEGTDPIPPYTLEELLEMLEDELFDRIKARLLADDDFLNRLRNKLLNAESGGTADVIMDLVWTGSELIASRKTVLAAGDELASKTIFGTTVCQAQPTT